MQNESNLTADRDWDHGTDRHFYEYYEQASLSPQTLERFAVVRVKVLKLASMSLGSEGPFDVLDVGCGAGTQCRLWAAEGHRVTGVDINEPLVNLARKRTTEADLKVDYRVDSATRLPIPDASMDVCLVPELLEHVSDWQSVLREGIRVLRPRGVLYLSTTNVLCPSQEEFDLPLYSWYPSFLKRRYEKLAVTTRPELVSHAIYPAVHWFSFYGLRAWLADLNMRAYDRFDMIDLGLLGPLQRGIVRGIRQVPPLRWLGHVGTPNTVVFAVKGEPARPTAS